MDAFQSSMHDLRRYSFLFTHVPLIRQAHAASSERDPCDGNALRDTALQEFPPIFSA